MNLRTHEQIHAELTQRANLKIFKSGLKLAAASGRKDQKEAHAHRVNLMLITAAAGTQVFKGANGRVLAAIAELHGKPRGVTDLREAGTIAKQIGTHLQFAVLALDPNRLRVFQIKKKKL